MDCVPINRMFRAIAPAIDGAPMATHGILREQSAVYAHLRTGTALAKAARRKALRHMPSRHDAANNPVRDINNPTAHLTLSTPGGVFLKTPVLSPRFGLVLVTHTSCILRLASLLAVVELVWAATGNTTGKTTHKTGEFSIHC